VLLSCSNMIISRSHSFWAKLEVKRPVWKAKCEINSEARSLQYNCKTCSHNFPRARVGAPDARLLNHNSVAARRSRSCHVIDSSDKLCVLPVHIRKSSRNGRMSSRFLRSFHLFWDSPKRCRMSLSSSFLFRPQMIGVYSLGFAAPLFGDGRFSQSLSMHSSSQTHYVTGPYRSLITCSALFL